jgi:hypothetical protein
MGSFGLKPSGWQHGIFTTMTLIGVFTAMTNLFVEKNSKKCYYLKEKTR